MLTLATPAFVEIVVVEDSELTIGCLTEDAYYSSDKIGRGR